MERRRPSTKSDEFLTEGQERMELLPANRQEFLEWLRAQFSDGKVPDPDKIAAAGDNVFFNQERLQEESNQRAIQIIVAGFTERMEKMRDELSARDATVSSISKYFEELIADLTDRVHRDPKTRLMNVDRFMEQLEAFLALEQRGHWCAVGLVDITSFKWYNDNFGHAVGDRIIDRVARLLREQIRSDDLIAQESSHVRVAQELHARFGGDEFCFLIPELDDPGNARVIAERFHEAVERFDWSTEDPRLVEKPVKVDVGVVCLKLGTVSDRRHVARQLVHDLLERADKLMYEAKGEQATQVNCLRVGIADGSLVEVNDP